MASCWSFFPRKLGDSWRERRGTGRRKGLMGGSRSSPKSENEWEGGREGGRESTHLQVTP